MSAVVMDGKALASKMREELAKEIACSKIVPGLAVVLAGDDPSSAIYVRNKEKACAELGIKSFTVRLPADVSQERIEAEVAALVRREDVHGVLVQLPLPAHINGDRVLSLIPPQKDVDGFSELNTGRAVLGKPALYPCTPHGIIMLLNEYNVPISGKHAVVVGRSNIVGKPAANLLLRENATVTVCHSKTENLAEITSAADILVAAVGKPAFITADMVKRGAAVIDVGTTRVDGKLKGDVDFERVKEVAGYITPVPGGVGPMTITMLMYNTVRAANLR